MENRPIAGAVITVLVGCINAAEIAVSRGISLFIKTNLNHFTYLLSREARRMARYPVPYGSLGWRTALRNLPFYAKVRAGF